MKRILGFAIPILVILGILSLVGWKIRQKTLTAAQMKTQSATRRNAASVVSVAVAGPASISRSVKAVGTLESPYQVKLSPNIAGRIDYLQVREGDPVKAGEVLSRIDPQEVEAQIVQAQGNLAEAKQRLAQAMITENANTVGINSNVGQQKALIASTQADYNETRATYEASVSAAHSATVDAQAKVASATSAIQTAQANLHLAQANLEDSQAKYTRTYNLYTQGFDSPQDLDDSKASVKVNQSTVAAQQKNVEAAQSALRSAEAQEHAAADQESIARKKGMSDIADARAKYNQALQTLRSAVANRAQIPAYAANIEALKSTVVAAQAALDQAIARRTYLIVSSPIDGTVTQRLFDPGAEATPGSPILVVQYLKWLYLTSALPVEYSDSVRPGMTQSITLDGLPGQVFSSKVVEINKSADPSSRQFMVRAKLDNSKGIFHAGMYAQVTMVTSHVVAPVAVPREAVTTDTSNNSTVTVVSNNVAHVTPVSVGEQDASHIQILSGISAGDRVIVLSYRPVQDGSKVIIGQLGQGGRRGARGAATGSGASTSGPGGGR